MPVIVSEIASDALEYDYIIVGGGTAGCVVSSRLAESLPDKRILVVEGGPSDFGNELVLDLKKQVDLWNSEYDYKYKSVPQPNGNSDILHSRAKILGGCSSHNGGISFRPFEYDARSWQKAGAKGWDFGQFVRLIDKLRTSIHPVYPEYQNPVDAAVIKASTKAFDIPETTGFNDETRRKGNLTGSAGFLSIAYKPGNCFRSSASVDYIHPIIRGEERRPNLTILANTWVNRINVKDGVVTGVDIALKSGRKLTVTARTETILCAGAIDTPRLMLLSGIGPHEHLNEMQIPVVHELPGVGENLMDHPETMLMWELNDPLPPQTVMGSDVGIFLRVEPENANGDDENVADLLCHIFGVPFDVNTKRLGFETPENVYCFLPNIPRSRSRGRLYLTSADPKAPPAIDFRYFTDSDGYDEKMVVTGLKAGRAIAKQSPFKELIKREVAPGPSCQSDKDLSEYGRKVANTVYHPCGTTKIGDVATDKLAVVDPLLRVNGLQRLRIADAGVFPLIPSVNPMLTVLAVGERAAELIIAEASHARARM